MDLQLDEAEAILNAGILFGNRVFSCSPQGKSYAFSRHLPNKYHGYPIDVRELRKRAGAIYSRLRAMKWCE